MPAIPLLAPIPPSLIDEPEAKSDEITVFVARKFVTMDPGWPRATAVAVADGRIVSVGAFAICGPGSKGSLPDRRCFKDKVSIRASSRRTAIR